jgi:hypothetical protein
MEIDNIIEQANAKAAESFTRWVTMRTMDDARDLVKMPPMPPDDIEEAILTIMEAFKMTGEPGRRAIMSKLNEYLQKRLLGYAAERAAQAVRSGVPDCIKQGLMALVVEGGREEFRDSITAMAMLYHSAERLNMNAAQMFAEAASLATPGELQAAMSHFPARRPENRDLAAFSLVEVNNEDGFSYEQLPWWKAGPKSDGLR